MLTHYIAAAMSRAAYEILGDGTYYGEIAELPGVYASGESLEFCRRELQEALEGWILPGLRLGHDLPPLDGITLTPQREAA